MNLKNKKHLFFDLDGTLAPSRQKIKPEITELLLNLGRTIIVVSGSENHKIRERVGNIDCFHFKLGQNGNQVLDSTNNLLWENLLSDEEQKLIHEHISRLRLAITHYIPNENDLIEDRGSQISFSIYGHNAPLEEKQACDADFTKRKILLEKIPFVSDTVDVKIGGTTCFDYFKKGLNKGTNTHRLIETMGWDKNECVYFGDALFPGGNDDSVVGIMDTVEVTDEEDTARKLREYFLT